MGLKTSTNSTFAIKILCFTSTSEVVEIFALRGTLTENQQSIKYY